MNPSLARRAALLELTCWVALASACGASGGAVSVSISPTTVAIAPGGTQQFAVTVTGPADAARASVRFTAPSGGTVSATGLYTAPSTAGTFQVVATSVADGSKSATATVTVGTGSGGACPSSGGKKPTGSACTPTTAGATACAGDICIGLNANAQNEEGVCSQPCTTDCGADGACIALGNGTSYCARTCAQTSDCCDGFVCTSSGAGGPNICFVTVASAGADCGACITITTAADVASVCDTSAVPNATRACDACSANPSPALCVGSPGHPEIFCCP